MNHFFDASAHCINYTGYFWAVVLVCSLELVNAMWSDLRREEFQRDLWKYCVVQCSDKYRRSVLSSFYVCGSNWKNSPDLGINYDIEASLHSTVPAHTREDTLALWLYPYSVSELYQQELVRDSGRFGRVYNDQMDYLVISIMLRKLEESSDFDMRGGGSLY